MAKLNKEQIEAAKKMGINPKDLKIKTVAKSQIKKLKKGVEERTSEALKSLEKNKTE